MTAVQEFFGNRTFFVPVLAWLIAQTLKVIIEIRKQGKIDFKRFVGSGGMPSSHSAFVVCLTTMIGKTEGVGSPVFALALAVSLVVMYDAAGVRRAAGKQAEILNKIIYSNADWITMEGRLKELIGHSPVEVIMGAILGLLVGLCV